MNFRWHFTALVAFSLLTVAAGRKNSEQVTTLSRPRETYQVVPEGSVEVSWGKLAAQLVNNQAVAPEHAAGYNGLQSIRYEGGPSLFVPRFAGLNLEHVNNGVATADKDLQFEPRKHPMELRRLDDKDL